MLAKPDAVFIYIGTYPDEDAARADYAIVKDLHAAGAVGTYDASVVTKDDKGKVHVNKDEMATRHGAWGGAAVGAVVGILFPPSIIVGAAVGRRGRRGIVVKNGGVLERLARCTTVLIDKTGTLTAGQPAVTAIVPAGALPPEEILALAASLDQASGHVLATAVVRAAAERGCPLVQPTGVTERPGQGIAGTVAGRQVRLGRAEWASVTDTPPWVRTVRRRAWLDGAITVFVAVNGKPAGALLLEDRIRPDARQTIRALRRAATCGRRQVPGRASRADEEFGEIIDDGQRRRRAHRRFRESTSSSARTSSSCGSPPTRSPPTPSPRPPRWPRSATPMPCSPTISGRMRTPRRQICTRP